MWPRIRTSQRRQIGLRQKWQLLWARRSPWMGHGTFTLLLCASGRPAGPGRRAKIPYICGVERTPRGAAGAGRASGA